MIQSMAYDFGEIINRLQGILGWNQQPLLNPVVDPEDDYIANLRIRLEKSGDKLTPDQEKIARGIFKTETARQRKEAELKRAQATPRPTIAPQQQVQATPQPAVLGAFAVDPKTLPTYNNPKELERVKPYLEYIKKSSGTYGVEPEVLAAALWRESAGFNPKYISGRHEDGTGRGIAGIDAKQRADVPDSVAYDPAQSIDWMAKTLKGYKDAEGGNTYNALRRYNGGPAYNSDRKGYKGIPVRDLTKKHADYITSNAQNLKQLFGSPAPSPQPQTP